MLSQVNFKAFVNLRRQKLLFLIFKCDNNLLLPLQTNIDKKKTEKTNKQINKQTNKQTKKKEVNCGSVSDNRYPSLECLSVRPWETKGHHWVFS